MVLPDINQAVRYSHRLIALQNGRRQLFGVEAWIEYLSDKVPLHLPPGVVCGR